MLHIPMYLFGPQIVCIISDKTDVDDGGEGAHIKKCQMLKSWEAVSIKWTNKTGWKKGVQFN
jgi:hypothetical protein